MAKELFLDHGVRLSIKYHFVKIKILLTAICYLGEVVEIPIEDDEIDNYQLHLKTDRPQEIDWDLSITQKPGQEQMVTKVVEEVG